MLHRVWVLDYGDRGVEKIAHEEPLGGSGSCSMNGGDEDFMGKWCGKT
jgi:hypothetical protein